MNEKEIQIPFTAGELAQLWSQYLNDSASVCILTYFLEKVEDEEIRPLIEFAVGLSAAHIEKITLLLKGENSKIPQGFCIEKDVDLTAPRLYSDSFILNYIHQMSKVGLTLYGAAVGSSARNDIEDYYMECLGETMKLFKLSTELLQSKGIFVRAPIIPYLEEVEFVKKQWFMLDVLGEKRPLAASEIENLFNNLNRNSIGVSTLTGFSQVAQNKDVKQFFIKGLEIGNKHIEIFRGKLEESKLPAPSSSDAGVTTSTAVTFSDKLMMYLTSGLIAMSIGYYGTGASQSPRGDLPSMYNRLSLEIQLYAEDGANIMIKNGWLEQPPLAADRDELIRKEK